MTKKKLPKRRRAICNVCGIKFSYKPVCKEDRRYVCPKHKQIYVGV